MDKGKQSMSTEKPNQEAQARFEESVDDATHAAIKAFEWIGLPEGDQLGDLLADLNSAIHEVMRDWL
jgi:hypothetical protein